MLDQLIALPPKMPVIAGCAAAPRSMVEEIIEQLIASLDLADGDPDLEDDDPAGDPLDIDGEPPSGDGRPISRIAPVYAADQSAGPTNEREALKAYYHDMREGRL
jgi:hypothetical protein